MKRIVSVSLLAGVALLLAMAAGADPVTAAVSAQDSSQPLLAAPISPTVESPECRTRKIYLPIITQTTGAASGFPSLDEFSDRVDGPSTDTVTGVYVPDVLALPVDQQPEDNPNFVSGAVEAVTQFRVAQNFGVTGLLAHNYLSGGLFYRLSPGQDVYIVHGDRTFERYRVAEVIQYQALDPYSPTSEMVDLETGEEKSAAEVFTRVYTGAGKVTFQTCLSKDGVPAWGRYFVIAEPASEGVAFAAP